MSHNYNGLCRSTNKELFLYHNISNLGLLRRDGAPRDGKNTSPAGVPGRFQDRTIALTFVRQGPRRQLIGGGPVGERENRFFRLYARSRQNGFCGLVAGKGGRVGHFKAFLASSYLCRLSGVKSCSGDLSLRAILRTGSPSQSRPRSASRFWRSVHFGLPTSFDAARLCVRDHRRGGSI
jgi:hypothetical protein